MKQSTFILVSAILSFVFGVMLFFVPAFAAGFLGIAPAAATLSVLRGLGGLIIGSGAINFLLYKQADAGVLKSLLLANIITHLFGIGADVWGIFDGALTAAKIAPVEITHLFIGIGSLIYLASLNAASKKTPA